MSKVGNTIKKINPYRYPSRIHNRTESPPQYASYPSYRSYIFREFGGQCVYCRKVMLPGEASNFEIEHFRPTKHFPKLSNIYTNLFLSCSRCNSKKSSYWSKVFTMRILNPCDDVMSENLSFQHDTVIGKSDKGRFNIIQLGLNDEAVINYRAMMLKIIETSIKSILSASKAKKKSASAIAERDKLIEMLSACTSVPVDVLKGLLCK